MDLETWRHEAKENTKSLFDDLDRRVKKLGSIADYEKQFEMQMINMRTCDLCGFLSKTLHHLDSRHRGSKACLKRQAEQRGEEYTPEARQTVKCECGMELLRGNMAKHLQLRTHKNNMAKLNGLYCLICDPGRTKDYSDSRRPRKALAQHCRGKKHLKKVQALNQRKCIPAPPSVKVV